MKILPSAFENFLTFSKKLLNKLLNFANVMIVMNPVSRFFKFRELNTDFGSEIRAGLVTFMTMAYIIFVNPIILMGAGVPFESVLVATCISSAVTTFLMGLWARYPIAAAPGMGMNAFFVSVAVGYELAWQTVMGMVFWSGLIFLVLTLTGVWDTVIEAIPATLKYAAACGIGAFIFYLGLSDAGIVTIQKDVMLPAPGNFKDSLTLISIGGLVLTVALMARKVKGAILLGILGTGVLAGIFGEVSFSKPERFDYSAFFALDIFGSVNFVKHPEYLVPLLVFLFFDMFDTVGTMIGIGEQAGFMRNGVLPRSREILASDATGTIVGALFGTSTVTSYIESAAGISEGGRSGFANIVTGAMFLLTLVFLLMVMHWGPGMIENASQTLCHITAPALIVVGVLMMSNVTKIEWAKFDEAIPAMLVIMLMPLSYRISMGLASGFVSWPLIKLVKGEGRKVSRVLYVLAGLIILGFIAVEV